MQYKDYSWTYFDCAVENNVKNKIQKELKNVWINLSLNLNITTCRFFIVLMTVILGKDVPHYIYF